MRFTIQQIVEITNAKLISGDATTVISGISTDSRQISADELFVALRGDRYDGHKFVASSLDRGAAGAMVMKETIEHPAAIMMVKDTLSALGDIAAHVRRSYNPQLIGITGSNGKTTVKELCASILSQAGACHKTQKNYNNLIGVPMTLLGLNEDHAYGVIEMGTNQPGEIARLAAIATPDVAILTNINHAHLDGLGSLDGILSEKEAIFRFTGKVAVYNPHQQYMQRVVIPENLRRVTFSDQPDTDISLIEVTSQDLNGSSMRIDIAGHEITTTTCLPGRHNIMNVLAACAATHALGISPELIAKGIELATAPNMRSEIIVSDHMTIINDSYNASPASMQAALDLLKSAPHSTKIAILGDMLELGGDSDELHAELGRSVAAAGIKRLVVTGASAKIVADAAIQGGMDAEAITEIGDVEEIRPLLRELTSQDACILVKASRALKLDRVVGLLRAVA